MGSCIPWLMAERVSFCVPWHAACLPLARVAATQTRPILSNDVLWKGKAQFLFFMRMFPDPPNVGELFQTRAPPSCWQHCEWSSETSLSTVNILLPLRFTHGSFQLRWLFHPLSFMSLSCTRSHPFHWMCFDSCCGWLVYSEFAPYVVQGPHLIRPHCGVAAFQMTTNAIQDFLS